MKPFITFLLFISVSFTGLAQDANCCQETPFVEVWATAEKHIEPDIAYIGLSIRELDDKRNPINLAAEEAKLIRAIEGIGLSKTDLTVDGLSGIQYKIRRKKIGYSQRKNYTLKVTDFTKIDDLMNALDQMETVDIHLKGTENSQIEKYKIETYAEAMRVAKAKSDAMLNVVGQNTGKVLFVNEQSVNVYRPAQTFSNTVMYNDESKMGYDKIENDLGLDKIIIKQSIHVRFAAE